MTHGDTIPAASQTYRILFVDAFDSFSNNIISLLEVNCPVEAIKVDISTDICDLQKVIRHVQAVVIGPGPGLANDSQDVGNINAVWALCEQFSIPVLGICLGFQTLVLRYGGQYDRLTRPRHGICTRVTTCERDIFSGLPWVTPVQYHSNFCTIGHPIEKSSSTADPSSMWEASPQCPDLVPLAWDLDRKTEEDAYSHAGQSAMRKENPNAILMSAKHRTLPFYGVQFHPESVRSDENARRAVMKWWDIAAGSMKQQKTSDSSWLYESKRFGNRRQHRSLRQASSDQTLPAVNGDMLFNEFSSKLDISSVIRALKLKPEMGQDLVLLDSERCLRPELGVHSIIGMILPRTLRIEYTVGDKSVRVSHSTTTKRHAFSASSPDVFSFLKNFVNARKVDRSRGSKSSPFWGGLIGYVNYEAGLETLDIDTSSLHRHAGRMPDIHFAYIERSVVFNHSEKKIIVQSTSRDDQKWVEETSALLRDLRPEMVDHKTTNDSVSRRALSTSFLSEKGKMEKQFVEKQVQAQATPKTSIHLPFRTEYEKKIRKCQQYISNGDSYELCLTDQTRILVENPKPLSEWSTYLRLRKSNPAPFGAYMKMGPVTVLSSSPERFLSWTRPGVSGDEGNLDSKCQFRPIKGTIKKYSQDASGNTHFVDRATAERLLSSAKEEAENLMIADLIRHDLAGVIGSRNVYTKDLMRVEEYESVYQLVTVIEGRIPSAGKNEHRSEHQEEQQQGIAGAPGEVPVQGIDVLATSLPPGSMTGAPKKRSCEILRELEGNRSRSIYAGVFGYLDVGGAGDFSVVIRTAYKYSEAEANSDRDEWYIGAGGAITTLSTLEGEWDEMNAKLRSVLPVFQTTE